MILYVGFKGKNNSSGIMCSWGIMVNDNVSELCLYYSLKTEYDING